MGKYKIISFDLDGTLLDDRKRISPECRKWIIEFQEKGGFVVLSSGRKYREIKDFVNELRLKELGKGFVISSSGMYLHNETLETVEVLEGYSSETAALIIKILIDSDISNTYKVVTNRLDYIVPSRFDLNCLIKNSVYAILKKNVRYKNAKNIANIEDVVEKISIYTKDKDAVASVLADIDLSVNIRLIDGNRVEIYDRSVDKSVALQRLLSKLNIDKNDLLLFGDDENDLACFDVFESTVAMGNSVSLIKKKAKFTTKCNNENGVYQILCKINEL